MCFIKFYSRTKASRQQHGTFANTYSVSMCAFIMHSCDTCREGRFQNKSPLKTECLKVFLFVSFQHAAYSESHRVLSKVIFLSNLSDSACQFSTQASILKIPAPWFDKMSQSTATMKVFCKCYKCIVNHWNGCQIKACSHPKFKLFLTKMWDWYYPRYIFLFLNNAYNFTSWSEGTHHKSVCVTQQNRKFSP